MANLREVKKSIKALCGDIVSECMIAGTLFPGANSEKLADVIYRTAKLQSETLRKLSISFDKTPRDFSSNNEYKKARSKYFKNAFESLNIIFIKEAESLIAELNKAVPKEADKK